MATNNNLKDFVRDIADAIRIKKGTTDLINPQDFSTEITNLNTNSDGLTAADIIMDAVTDLEDTNNTITYVAGSTMMYKQNLKTLSLPVCSSIGRSAFYGCSTLEQVSIPMCTNISINAFAYCSNLKSIYMPAASNIGWLAFSNCSSLESVNLPEVTTLDSAFYGCSNLSYANLPNCKTLSGSVFYGCNLSYIDLPKCERVSPNVFIGNTNLS